MSKNIRNESRGTYGSDQPWQHSEPVPPSDALQLARDDFVLERAVSILNKRLRSPGTVMDSPCAVKTYLRLKLAERQDEVFAMLLLDTSHALITYQEVATGTIDRAMVYGRSVARAWLEHNAAACILVHNHPSGRTEPSDDDMLLTTSLTRLGEQLSVRVLDHMIVGGANVKGEQEVYSFAEHGMMN